LARREKKKKIRTALADANLQEALSRASAHHFHKFTSLNEDAAWEALKEKARSIRKTCLEHLPELIQRFTREAEKSGARVHPVSTPAQALSRIVEILSRRKAKLVVKSKSMVSEEIGLNAFLEKKGFQVVETDLGEWIVQLAGERPSHITAPALHKTKEEVARLLSAKLGMKVPPEPEEIVKLARRHLRRAFLEADAGISGANLAVAETGSLVIVSNEGNARLVTSLPPLHIALVTVEKCVETLEQSATLIKTLVRASSGMKVTTYVSFITGTSLTTDIEKQRVTGVHGPEEVHIILLDNGRLEALKDAEFSPVLNCLKCGGCMLVCPVFQSLGGHLFGGPVYPGGIGLLLTALTLSPEVSAADLDLCADCKKCETFCPVGIPTGDLLLRLKARGDASFWEKGLSFLFRKGPLLERGAGILARLQKPWEKEGMLRNLPLSWAGKKSIPALKLEKTLSPSRGGKPLVYFFQGCMGKLFFPEIREAVFRNLSAWGYDVVSPDNQVCCGAPSLHLGREEDAIKLARLNLQFLARENPDFILFACPTGTAMFREKYPVLVPGAEIWREKVRGFADFAIREGHLFGTENKEDRGEIFYHHSCHSLKAGEKEAPLTLLRSRGYRPVQEEEPVSCCGFCGVFSLKNPLLSTHLAKKKHRKILDSGRTLVATDCPGCLFQLKSILGEEEKPFKAFHIASLV